MKDTITCPSGKKIGLTCSQGYLHPYDWHNKCCGQTTDLYKEYNELIPVCNCLWAQVFQTFAEAGDLR